jgi:predicted SprT family Zn-dependent metalloprotease
MLQERIALVRTRIEQLIQKANQLYNTNLPPIDIRFDLKGRNAGCAMRRGGKYSMRFNTDLMQTASWDHIYEETLPHELAHIMCFFLKLDRGHGQEWKKACRLLGGTGERCHYEPTISAKGRTFAYVTTHEKVVTVNEFVHNSIQRGNESVLRKNFGKINKDCIVREIFNPQQLAAFQLSVANREVPDIVPSIAPSSVSVMRTLTPNVTKHTVVESVGLKKSDLVRNRITIAKACDESENTVVQWVIDHLRMTKSLAKTYVKNNWHKA